jgi:hypothetical protein
MAKTKFAILILIVAKVELSQVAVIVLLHILAPVATLAVVAVCDRTAIFHQSLATVNNGVSQFAVMSVKHVTFIV